MSKSYFFLIIILIINSCATYQNNNKKIINEEVKSTELINKINRNNKTPEWLFLSGKIKANNQKSDSELNFSIKSKTDSVILVSVTALLGFEIFKAKITTDSIIFINKVNKTVFFRRFSNIQDIINQEILFSDIIGLMTSNQKILKDKYKYKNEGQNYYLESNKTKYIIDKNSKKIISSNVYFNNLEKNMFCEFSKYKKIKTYLFPMEVMFKIKNFSAQLYYKKVILDEPQKTVFKIPENYVKK